MTASRLSAINSFGCLILVAIIVSQWRHEQKTIAALNSANLNLSQAWADTKKQSDLRAALEKDVAALKESIALNQSALDEANTALANQAATQAQLQSQLNQSQADLDAAKAQFPSWLEAIHARDAQISELQTKLDLALNRLNQAILKLKNPPKP